ncbi:Kynurenine 3-monooxygenase [Seminavis robusta]|uniref:Kynurenine 3-monooxygenase n=1 Tax=Seminavis robusta TaxID=568900 RepID=A0A9N8EHV8_9STRA|nr:Kynurenine 3-monooxygenase [Seminavis robusta]|eukprot:Sro1125_g243930.1 Kynurenine 3-monooxygenase (441) ;mRNA; r:18417-19739
MSSSTSRVKIVIVGAGPCGLLLAWNLLQHNDSKTYDIFIVEKRSDPRSKTDAASSDRTFPIALQSRGWNALPKSIQSTLSNQGVWVVGLCLHGKKGRRFIPRDKPNLSIDRNQLAKTLLEAVAQAATSKSKVQFHFDSAMEDLDHDAKTISIRSNNTNNDTTTTTTTLAFDYLVAADGGRSQVRQELCDNNLLTADIQEIPDDYRTIHLSRAAPKVERMDSDKIHGWMFPTCKIIAVPIHPGVVSGAIIFDKGSDPFATMTEPHQVQDYFAQLSPEELAFLVSDEEADALLNRPTATLLSVRCSQLHTPHTLLLGDAAHAVSASCGQGCNAALQDVQVFCDTLAQQNHEWNKALPAYTQARLGDAHAVSELSDYTHPRSGWLKFEFIARTILRKLLPLWLANWLLKPLPTEVLAGTDISYTQVLAQTQWWVDRVKKQTQQ